VSLSTGTRLALAHLLGDYVLQTHHQAVTKTRRWGPALAHAASYTAAHGALVTRDPLALAVIGGTHAVIDHYRLARHLNWFKNQFAPRLYRPPHTATGFHEGVPDWLAFWLLFIVDNTVHLCINALVVDRVESRSPGTGSGGA
jgi:hypothetical protein